MYNRRTPQPTNPMLYAVIGGMAALILAIGGFVAYKEISASNDQQMAQRLYDAQHNVNYRNLTPEQRKDPVIMQEANRRSKEMVDSLHRMYER